MKNDKDVEKLEYFLDCLGNIKCGSNHGKWHRVSSKIKVRIIIWFNNSTSRCISLKTENRDLGRYLYTHDHSRIIHNSQNVKTTQVSTKGWVNKMWFIFIMEYYTALKRKKNLWHMLQHAWTLKTLCQVKLCRYKNTNILWLHLYEVPRLNKFRETERRMVIPKDWEKKNGSFVQYRISLWEDEIVLEMD